MPAKDNWLWRSTDEAIDQKVEEEEKELVVLESYLPQMMSQEEIEPVARQKKEARGVTDRSKMGQFIGAIMKELGGNADGADVKAVVEKLF